ncbi:MAG: alpha/beta hydrolase [Myxococcota bacterium]
MSLAYRLEVSAGRRTYHTTYALFRKVAGLEQHHIAVESTTIPYWQGGLGAPVLMLHGFADCKETWMPIATSIARHHTLIAPDLPGYGDAGAIAPDQATLPALARTMLTFLDRLGRQQVHLLGSSMGGGVALMMACLAPNRVRSLTLLGSMGPEVVISELKRRIVEEEENFLLPTSQAEWEEMMDLIFFRRPLMPRQIRLYMAKRHIEARDIYDRQFDAMIEPDNYGLPLSLRGLGVPTLVVHGTQDNLVHAETGRKIAAELDNAELMMLPNVGHAPHWEAPGAWMPAWRRITSRT